MADTYLLCAVLNATFADRGGVGVGVAVGAGVAVGEGVWVGLGVAAGEGVRVGLGVAVGAGVRVGLGVADTTATKDLVAEGVGSATPPPSRSRVHAMHAMTMSSAAPARSQARRAKRRAGGVWGAGAAGWREEGGVGPEVRGR